MTPKCIPSHASVSTRTQKPSTIMFTRIETVWHIQRVWLHKPPHSTKSRKKDSDTCEEKKEWSNTSDTVSEKRTSSRVSRSSKADFLISSTSATDSIDRKLVDLRSKTKKKQNTKGFSGGTPGEGVARKTICGGERKHHNQPLHQESDMRKR